MILQKSIEYNGCRTYLPCPGMGNCQYELKIYPFYELNFYPPLGFGD